MSDLKGKVPPSTQDEEDRVGELLCLKIKAHLEEMFSDSHLAEDGFLLKHIQKNKQGYINLKLLTCLKKIKALTTNWYMTLAAAVCSDLLEVNDECTKVRRKEPLPQWLMSSPTTRLLLIRNNSDEQREEDGGANVSQHPSLLFKVLESIPIPGSMISIRILHPGEELPKDLQCYTKRHSELSQHVCAVVRFDSLEAVRRTLSALRAEETVNRKSLCVVPLGYQSMQNTTRSEPSEENNSDQCQEDSCSNENLLESSKVQQEPSLQVQISQENSEAFPPEGYPERDTRSNGQLFFGLNQRFSRTGWCHGDNCTENFQSPWVFKRKSAATAAKFNIPCHPNTPGLIQGVLRQPYGPNGTKGFHPRKQKSNSLYL